MNWSPGQVEVDDDGYVVTANRQLAPRSPACSPRATIVDHTYRQAITAAGSGCAAAIDAERWLAHRSHETQQAGADRSVSRLNPTRRPG